MMNMAQAKQLRSVTWVLQAGFWIYFVLEQTHVLRKPSNVATIWIFMGYTVLFAVQIYAIRLVDAWKKVASLPREPKG
jgi:hypothetical protein